MLVARRVPQGARRAVSAVIIRTMSYHGPATIVSNGKETLATVTLHVDRSQPIKSWGGTGTVEVSGAPDIALGMSVIRLPDGREAQALVTTRYNSGASLVALEISGSGQPPFDFGAGMA